MYSPQAHVVISEQFIHMNLPDYVNVEFGLMWGQLFIPESSVVGFVDICVYVCSMVGEYIIVRVLQ